MAKGTKLATAYVQIIPTSSGLNASLRREIDPAATSAGISGGESFAKSFSDFIVKSAIGVAIGRAIKEGITQGLEEGAALQQSMGGVETLFKNNADKVKAYADEAYRTAGLSANQYMEQVTSFSASLLQSLNGDVYKAAESANMALTDMSDNANKFGTDIQLIQNAYQGFAKQNYTMLDNLKLGYGGTKEEMERLLKDAQEYLRTFETLENIELDISSLDDVYTAIHAIQLEMGVTGTTAKEASETFSGSLATMQAAAKNVIAKMTLGEDVSEEMDDLGESVKVFLDNNLMPMLTNFLNGSADKLPDFIVDITDIMIDHAPELGRAGLRLGKAFAQGLEQAVDEVFKQNKVLRFLFDPAGLLFDTIWDSTSSPAYMLNSSDEVNALRQGRANTVANMASVNNYNFNVDAASLDDVRKLREAERDAQRKERMGKG